MARVTWIVEPVRRPDGRPTFDVGFYAVSKRGGYGAAVWSGSQDAVSVDDRGWIRDGAFRCERQD